MWWMIFAVWIIFGIITQIMIKTENDTPEKTSEREKAERRSRVWFWFLIAVAAIPLLYVLYWFWYYVCCGFLVVDMAETFVEQVLYFIMSVVALIFFGGIIAILLGWWNPRL